MIRIVLWWVYKLKRYKREEWVAMFIGVAFQALLAYGIWNGIWSALHPSLPNSVTCDHKDGSTSCHDDDYDDGYGDPPQPE
jgi:hypothetical protein